MAWPSGQNGTLQIKAGEKSTFAAGTTQDFESIIVEAGGTLEIATGSCWTMIGCSGDFILHGTLLATGANYFTSGDVTATSPDGVQLSIKVKAPAGGNGGNAYNASDGHQADGNGGGGAACRSNGSAANPNYGGNGGTCPLGTHGRGGRGARLFAQRGEAGESLSLNYHQSSLEAGGGDGGSRGLHGHLVYLRVLGNLDATGGEFQFSGADGGDGGEGGTAVETTNDSSFFGGGGGGGGAGGNGGHLVIRYGIAFSPGDYTVDGGRGGRGGRAGGPAHSSSTFGNDGDDGEQGSYDPQRL